MARERWRSYRSMKTLKKKKKTCIQPPIHLILMVVTLQRVTFHSDDTRYSFTCTLLSWEWSLKRAPSSTSILFNVYPLQRLSSSTSILYNVCPLQHLSSTTSTLYNVYSLQRLPSTTYTLYNVCLPQRLPSHFDDDRNSIMCNLPHSTTCNSSSW